MKTLLAIFGILLILGGVFYFIYRDGSEETLDQKPNTIIISNFNFQPAELEVTQGTIVTFINRDNIIHTATSDNGIFDSGNLGKNASFEFTFDEPGTYDYHCTPHPQMRGRIIVK